MIPDDVKEKIISISRQAMEVARSSINVATGNTLVITVPLVDVEVPDDIASLVRSVAQSTGFGAQYSQDGLVLSWTNAHQLKTKPPAATLEDVHKVLKEMLALQVDTVRKNEGWSRADVIATLSLLLSLIVAILGHLHADLRVEIDVSPLSTHDRPAAQPYLRPVPRPEISPRLPKP